MIKCICDVAVSSAASVTKEVEESGGGCDVGAESVGDGDMDGEGDPLGVAGAGDTDGLMAVLGNDCVVITVGTGRDLSRRCASVRCARILLMLSECEGVPVTIPVDGSTLEGVGMTRGAGVPAGVGVACGVRVTVEGVGCGVATRGVGCGVGLTCGCCGGMTVTVRGRVSCGVGEAAGVCACADAAVSNVKLSRTGNIERFFINPNSLG